MVKEAELAGVVAGIYTQNWTAAWGSTSRILLQDAAFRCNAGNPSQVMRQPPAMARARINRVRAISSFVRIGHGTAVGLFFELWTKTYASVRLARTSAARCRAHWRQRQRPSRSSTCRFSGLSACPLVHVSGMLRCRWSEGLSSSQVSLKHTTPLEWLQSGPRYQFEPVCSGQAC